ncbi:unnamed protein product [Closterium sp. NIES-54]
MPPPAQTARRRHCSNGKLCLTTAAVAPAVAVEALPPRRRRPCCSSSCHRSGPAVAAEPAAALPTCPGPAPPVAAHLFRHRSVHRRTRVLLQPRRPALLSRPTELPRPAESCCYCCCCSLATAAAPAAMANPNVLTFDAEGRAVDFQVWWTTRDAAGRLAVCSHLPSTERAHFSQYKSAKTLYDAVVARYSSPATAALSRLMLPYLFSDLVAFATVADLITHLRTSDSRYRAVLPAEFCAKNPPPPHVLGLPPSSGPAPSLECPPPVQSESQLQLASPLPAPSPYAGPTGGLAERRELESRPASPVCTARTGRRVPRQRPPAVPGTHQMALRPSTAPQRVPLPSPPESSLGRW